MMLREQITTGAGIYTIAEAASYARMSPVTLARWFKGNTSGERVFEIKPSERFITFHDFIQALAVRNLRAHYGVSLQKIREAVQRAEEKHGIKYPFAMRHTTYLFDGQIWIQLKESEFVQVSGREHGQVAMTKVIESFLKDVCFDENGLAAAYKAYSKGDNVIRMDPKVRFGEPVLQGCGYTPGALYEAAMAEGSIEATALAYGVTKEQVETSIEYYDSLAA